MFESSRGMLAAGSRTFPGSDRKPAEIAAWIRCMPVRPLVVVSSFERQQAPKSYSSAVPHRFAGSASRPPWSASVTHRFLGRGKKFGPVPPRIPHERAKGLSDEHRTCIRHTRRHGAHRKPGPLEPLPLAIWRSPAARGWTGCRRLGLFVNGLHRFAVPCQHSSGMQTDDQYRPS